VGEVGAKRCGALGEGAGQVSESGCPIGERAVCALGAHERARAKGPRLCCPHPSPEDLPTVEAHPIPK
jgi:hypothetical protein